jgi:hypothetical protein
MRSGRGDRCASPIFCNQVFLNLNLFALNYASHTLLLGRQLPLRQSALSVQAPFLDTQIGHAASPSQSMSSQSVALSQSSSIPSLQTVSVERGMPQSSGQLHWSSPGSQVSSPHVEPFPVVRDTSSISTVSPAGQLLTGHIPRSALTFVGSTLAVLVT